MTMIVPGDDIKIVSHIRLATFFMYMGGYGRTIDTVCCMLEVVALIEAQVGGMSRGCLNAFGWLKISTTLYVRTVQLFTIQYTTFVSSSDQHLFYLVKYHQKEKFKIFKWSGFGGFSIAKSEGK